MNTSSNTQQIINDFIKKNNLSVNEQFTLYQEIASINEEIPSGSQIIIKNNDNNLSIEVFANIESDNKESGCNVPKLNKSLNFEDNLQNMLEGTLNINNLKNNSVINTSPNPTMDRDQTIMNDNPIIMNIKPTMNSNSNMNDNPIIMNIKPTMNSNPNTNKLANINISTNENRMNKLESSPHEKIDEKIDKKINLINQDIINESSANLVENKDSYKNSQILITYDMNYNLSSSIILITIIISLLLFRIS
jgi:hypothetical protein